VLRLPAALRERLQLADQGSVGARGEVRPRGAHREREQSRDLVRLGAHVRSEAGRRRGGSEPVRGRLEDRSAGRQLRERLRLLARGA
jgi:hypothetical protein